MPWAAIDDFNSYTDGDLTGNNGGSGWSAAWSGNAAYDVQGTVVNEGTKAVENASGVDNQSITRDYSAVTSGIVRFAIRRTSKAAASIQVRLNSDTRIIVDMGTTNIAVETGAVIVSGYSVDTWYIIHVKFDAATDQYWAREDSASSWTVGPISLVTADFTQIQFLTNGAFSGTWYIDDIRAGSEPGGGGHNMIPLMGAG